jgi:hypothetical protein
MDRVLEPELMDEDEQARAYSEASVVDLRTSRCDSLDAVQSS